MRTPETYLAMEFSNFAMDTQHVLREAALFPEREPTPFHRTMMFPPFLMHLLDEKRREAEVVVTVSLVL